VKAAPDQQICLTDPDARLLGPGLSCYQPDRAPQGAWSRMSV
jgi:hypothetical protein